MDISGESFPKLLATPQEPAVPLAEQFLSPLRGSTRHLPRADQFDFWRECDGNLLEHLAPAAPPSMGFPADAATWRFAGLALMTAETAGGRYRRSALQARRDGIDHWTVTVAIHGERVFRSTDSIQVMRPGAAFVGSLDQPFETGRTDSGWLHLYVPRDAFPDIGAAIDAARLRPVEGAMGRVLRDYLALLAKQLPTMRQCEAGRLAEATHAIFAAALAPSGDRLAAAEAPLRGAQLARVRRIVRDNLGSATLGPEKLCRLAGMSRSQLYRLFEPLGGVAAHIQAERLRAAQRALCDPAERRSIARIAEDVGLFDGSSFSRMFRRAFGCSPRDMRLLALSSPGTVPLLRPARTKAPQTIGDLLRSL